jgi:hypothetical protein
MPGGDGRGPASQGSGTGRGLGQGLGQGRGRMGGPKAGGPGGLCVCSNPNCDGKVSHQPGKPCYEIACPKCGAKMVRE